MDKIKSILSPGSKKDDETMYNTGDSQAGPTGKVTGAGSHFGTGGTGTDSAGYSLGKNTEGHGYSAAEPTGDVDSAGYATGRGSEGLGHTDDGNHVNTAAASETLQDEYPGGQATIGQTSTHSSHPLPSGNQTSSIVDPNSSHPNTFRKPEMSTTGVGPDGAEIAARRAMDPESASMPGGFPSEESSNPYASSTLDPRVDSAGHAPSHAGRDTALGAGAGAAGIGAYETSKRHEPQASTTTAPSTLTSTTDPTYGSATETRGLDSAQTTAGSTSTPATTTTTNTDDSTQKKGMVGTVLGALGLGGGAAVAKHEHDKDSAIDSTPSTTTGVGSYSTPSQSGQPPSHHRKESIPTTAYPSGNLDSVRPIAGPTGQAPTKDSSNYGKDAAILGGVAGAGALGSHEYESHRSDQPTGLSGTTSGPTGSSTFQPGMTGTTSSAPHTSTVHDIVTGGGPQSSEQYGNTSTSGSGLAATAGTTGAVIPDAPSSTTGTAAGDESTHHYGRDAAIGGGALGTTGLAAHEYEKSKGQPTQVGSGITPTSQQYGNQPIAGAQGTQSFSDSVDPRTDAAGNANHGTGVGAVPTATSGQTEDQHHYGRDAAIVGGGATAAGVGAHEYSEHDAKKADKEHAKLQKSQTREIEKEQKAHEKELKKEQKAEEKAERKHEKEVAKEEKKQEKEAAKAEKRQEKEGAAAIGAGTVGAGGAYEYEKHHPTSTSGGGLAAADATDREAYNKQNRYTSATADPAVDPTVRNTSASADQGTEPHLGRDTALGTAGAATIGGGAYEAEKHHHEQTTPTSKSHSGLAEADDMDRHVHGKDEREKKPNLFKRIFKRKKNEHTGEEEDDPNDYEDVPHDHEHPHGVNLGAGVGTTGMGSDSPSSARQSHVEGQLAKPSYNPFKKEVASDYGAVEGKI